MSDIEIPRAAVERNRAWIEAITASLAKRGGRDLSRKAMRDAGRRCAVQILEKVIKHYGRAPRSVDELIEAINKRRVEVLGKSNLWTRDGNSARFRLTDCGCDLVEAGLAEPNPVFCLCSAGMFEALFASVCRGEVRTEIVKAIGCGDDCCEFTVHFEG